MIAVEEGFSADAAAVTEMFTFSHQVVQICTSVPKVSDSKVLINGKRRQGEAGCQLFHINRNAFLKQKQCQEK